jgi:hypothetical protein
VFTIPQILNYAPAAAVNYPFMTLYKLYDGGVNPQVGAVFNDSNVNVIQITMPFSTVVAGNVSNGDNNFYIYVGTGVLSQTTGAFLIAPTGTQHGMTFLNLTFNLVKGVDFITPVTEVSVRVATNVSGLTYNANWNPDISGNGNVTTAKVLGLY